MAEYGFSDFDGYLKDLIQQSSTATEGLTAKKKGLYSDMANLDNYAEQSYSPLGTAAVAAIGALLGGGSIGDAATLGSKFGFSAYNNLEEQEKEKKLRIANEIRFTEGLINDQTNRQQALQSTDLNYQAGMNSRYLSGDIIGTDLYNQARSDSLSDYQTKRSIENSFDLRELAARQAMKQAYARPTIQAESKPKEGIDSEIAKKVLEANGLPYDPSKSYTTAELNALNNTGNILERRKEENRHVDELQQKLANVSRVNGFEPIPGRPVNAKLVDSFAERTMAVAMIKKHLPYLKSALEKGSQLDPETAKDVRVRVAMLTPHIATMNSAGKALTASEIDLSILQGLPAMLDNRGTGWSDLLWDRARGIDPVKQLTAYEQAIEDSQKVAGAVAGLYSPNMQYTPQERDMYGVPTPDLRPRTSFAPLQPSTQGEYVPRGTGPIGAPPVEAVSSDSESAKREKLARLKEALANLKAQRK